MQILRLNLGGFRDFLENCIKTWHTFNRPYESPKKWALEFVEKEGVVAPKRLSRPWEWTFCKNCSSLYQSKDNLIFISKFNNHYLDLLKEVYNVSVPQEAQKILAIKVWGIQNPSYLPYKMEGFLSPRTLTAGIFWLPCSRETLYTSFERPEKCLLRF